MPLAAVRCLIEQVQCTSSQSLVCADVYKTDLPVWTAGQM